jgi:predicted nuclease of predicted toxin-antitoxin system
MKLLFDENLSDRVVPLILDLFPDSAHVKTLGFMHSDDDTIWKYAAAHGFAIVFKDSDFHQRSLVYGPPPKFVYLRVGNCPTQKILDLLRANAAQIQAFQADPAASILILS